MKQGIRVSNYGFTLRPIEYSDASFIVQLRSDPDLSRFLHPITPTIESQIEWLKLYFERQNDFYFVIESIEPKTKEGLIGLYDVDFVAGRAEWGRWILRSGSLAVVASVLFVFQVAFDVLELDEIHCFTAMHNAKVVSFHDSCGLARQTIHKSCQIREEPVDMVEHCLRKNEWPQVRNRLIPIAERISLRLKREVRDTFS
jgi:RimJ/RimL family protein N-acetyltransferase